MSELSDDDSINLSDDVVEIRPIRPRRNFEAFKELKPGPNHHVQGQQIAHSSPPAFQEIQQVNFPPNRVKHSFFYINIFMLF